MAENNNDMITQSMPLALGEMYHSDSHHKKKA